ncbi:Kelch repeat-containing protein [Brevundimonas sp.]|uniref:Kelch repeat-containing protein n=1 Tax=Brevundimonas sp. TaxID=1871086 RepID=UPI002E0DDBF2|nr:kelch repeat-containing protein [Brevundimonas sp.]
MTRIDRRALIASAAALGACSSLPDESGPVVAESWESRPDMPWAVQEVYAAVWMGRIAVAGGLKATPGQPLHIEDRTALFHPPTNRWGEGPMLPAPRHHPMMVAEGETLWAIGGYGRSGAGEWTNATEVWSLTPGATEWAAGPALPVPQAEAVGLSHGGRVHLVTGRSPGGAANANWNDQADVDRHLVLAGGRWETARPCPMARNSAAGAVLDGALWVAGGRTVTGGGTGRLDRYDPVADRWDTLAPIPRSEAAGQQVGGGLAMVAVDGRLIAFGGEWFRPRAEGGGGGVFAETWVYAVARDVWERGPDMRTPRHGLAAVALNGAVVAIAGGDVVSGGNATGVVEAWTPGLFH